MYLYGASGHAKVIIDILRANNIPIEALFDDDDSVNRIFDYPVLRSSEVRGPLIISIGNNEIRKNIAERLQVEFGKAFHPSAIISEEVRVEYGTVIMQGAIVQSSASIGKHCIVNTGASVDHDCRIGDYVHISPHATLCGNVTVGEGTWIGAGATIVPGVKIGAWSVIGAGAIVLKDIPSDCTAVGVPARPIKFHGGK
ncbi:MAG: acetyltransferase [Bacteroidales bacterium]|nr:acetyltransferase [Bacteroidales bacterium]MDE7102704.1 acetyltransferase [Bacteroidales bacterium]